MAERLNQIETVWAVVHGSYASEPNVRRNSQAGFLERYGPAARRYLLGAVRDTDVANEIYQEFALRYVRGDLRAASPDRGKFRSYLKSILYRMVADHYRKQKRKKALRIDNIEPAAAEIPDRESETSHRQRELFARSIAALESDDNSDGNAYSLALRLRIEQPQLRADGFAAALSSKIGRTVTPSHARVIVHRAREQFARILLDQIAESMGCPTKMQLEDELMNLELLPYCLSALQEYRAGVTSRGSALS